MKYFWILFLSVFALESTCLAQTADEGLQQRQLAHRSQVVNEVFALPFDNPSMKYLWNSASLTEIYLGGTYQHADLPVLVQEGNGQRYGSVEVASFLRKENCSLWGRAYYKNGKQTGRCWNETSDYALLYPYVMGDTLGGSLRSEQYYFSGGCAYRLSRYVVGVEGSYKAAIEYRNADPRPKNLTGDLKARIGLSRYLGASYLLGIDVAARKYKQTNDLVFYDELGVPNIYHFTGLGSDYYRFRGAKGESFYKGHAFGGGLTLLPVAPEGVSAALRYGKFKFDKVISSLNELPMASVDEDQLRAEMGWRDQRGTGLHKSIGCGFGYTRRRGTENIFGTPSGNIFTQLGAQEKYMNKIYSGGLAGTLAYTFPGGGSITLLGRADYLKVETTYLFPAREMQLSFTTAQLDLRAAFPHKQWIFSGAIGGRAKFGHHAALRLGDVKQPGDGLLNTPAQSNFEAMRANGCGAHAQWRTDYSWKGKYGVFMAVDYGYWVDQRDSKRHDVFGQIGFTF